MTNIERKEQRRLMARQQRLPRLRRLRQLGVPKWVIKMEQIALVLNRDGMKFATPGHDPSNRQAELQIKYVCPLLDRN